VPAARTAAVERSSRWADGVDVAELSRLAGTDVALIGHTRLGEGGEMARLAATPSRKRLVPRAALVALIALLGLLVAGPADAQRARHVTINVEDTFVDDFWTETCGTTVVISVEGTLHVTLLYNREGLIVKEIDPSSGLTVTFSARQTGNSFSFPTNTAIFDYGAGAEVGSTFTAKFVGLGGHVPGVIASDAGQVIVTGGVVEGFDEFGIPLLNFENAEVVVEHGNFESQEDIAAAICGTLTA
jgi:predicted aconitase with swiveling domain